MAPPFRADHIGSLIRPLELGTEKNSRSTAAQPFSQAKSAELTKTAIKKVVQDQLARSVRPITTGEYERTAFYTCFFQHLEGIEIRNVPFADGYRSHYSIAEFAMKAGRTARQTAICTGKIKRNRSVFLEDWQFLKSLLPEELWSQCKWTMPAPTEEFFGLKRGMAYEPSTGYTSDKEYLADMAAAYRAEIHDLYDAGLRNIQIDDPYLTFFATDWLRKGLEEDGRDWDEFLDLCIWGVNECFKDQPSDLHIGVHMCRGNYGAAHFATGSYEAVARKVFNELKCNTFYLEYDTERAGDFEPLRFLPVGKNVVLGLVTTKTDVSENVDKCVAKVYEAAEVIGRGQARSKEEVLRDTLGVSPQCGFGSVSWAKTIGEEVMWHKLALVREIAKRIWPNEVT